MGKAHPDTLDIIMNMATMYMEGLEDFTKAEEMYRLSLGGREAGEGSHKH